MKLSTALPSLLPLALLAPLGLRSAPTSGNSEPLEFQVDPVHSHVLWKIEHRKVSYFYGRFDQVSGAIAFDPEHPEESSVYVEVQAKSIDTRTEKLNQHLRSPDFFDVVQYPVITFESQKVEPLGDDRYRVTGELSLHGVTREISVEVEHVGTAEGRDGTLIGFHTVFTIDRTEYGMKYGTQRGDLGKEVELIVSLEARSEA